MFVILNVFHKAKNGKEKLGDLRVGRNAPSGKFDGRFFEWRGENGTSDGGVWVWSNHEIYQKFYTMELISHRTSQAVVILDNPDWGTVEPVEPLFKSGASGDLAYIPFEGKAFRAFWERL